MSEYKLFTPALRAEIKEAVREEMQELNTCEDTCFVRARKTGLVAFLGLIDSLSDGYPIPMQNRR